MNNISKSRGFKVPKYIENVGQSVRLSGIKLIKEKYLPNTTSLIDNISQYSRDIASNSSGSDKSFKAILDKNSSIKNITDALKFAKEDLQSGKFINPERADELSKDFMGDFGDFGFDFENDIGDANISFDEDSADIGISFNEATDVSMDAKVSTVMTSKALAKSSAIISETVHKSGKANMGAFIEYDKQKTATTNSFFASMFAETNNSINTVNNNIGTIISFHNDISKDYYDKSLSALQSIVDPIKNLEGYMKEMTEMKRNMYDDYIRTNGPGSNKRNKYNDSLGYGFDPESFMKNALDNVKGSNAGSILSMFEGDMGKMLIDSPLQAIPGIMIGSLLSKTLTGSLTSFDKTIGNFFKGINNKMGAMKNDNSIFGKIASIFHVQNNMKTSVSAGGYVKGPVPFDGVTKKAIVDVIAPTLLRIESHLTGTSLKNMNYETGKYESVKETKKRFEQELDRPIVSSMSDTRNRMSWIMRDSGLDDSTRKGAEASFDEILKDLVKNQGKYYNPHKKDETYKMFKGNKKISKDSIKLFNKVFMSMSPEDRIAFQSEIADARASNSTRLENLDKEMSEKGYSVLFDNSIKGGNKSVNAKVSNNDYTKQIRDILVRGIKVFGSTTEGSSQAPSYYDITGMRTTNSGLKIKGSTLEEGHLKFKSNLAGSEHAKRNAKISGAKINSSKYYDLWEEGEQGSLSNNKVMRTIDKYARKTKNMAVGGAYKALYGENPYEPEEAGLPKVKGIRAISGNDNSIKGGTGGRTSLNWKSSKSNKDSGSEDNSKSSKTLDSINNAMDKYTKLFTDNKEKISKFTKGAGMSLGAGLMFNSPLMAMGGLTVSFINSSDRAKNILFGEMGEDGERKEGGLIPPKLQKFMKNAMGNMGLGALASTVMSSTFLGGFGLTAPIVGAGLGMLASSETVKGYLFGGLDKEGNREGGLISKEMQTTMKKFALPTLGGLLGGGIAGQLLHQFAGFGAMTPFLTGTLGAGLGILSKSDKFNNWMFGEIGEDGKRKGGFDTKMKDFFKKNMGSIGGAFGGMALGGLTIGGPAGMIMGSLGGLSLGIMSQSEGVKSYLFGDVDPETMKRKGGLMGQISTNMKSWFTESIANPFKEAITPIKSAFKDMTQSIKGVFLEGWKGISSSVNDVFKESVGKPLKDLVKEKITDPLKNMISKLIFGAGKILGGIISAPMKGITAFAKSLTGNKDKELDKDMAAYDKMDSTAEKATKGVKGFTGKFKDFMGTMKVAGMSLFAVKKASEVDEELDEMNKGDKKKTGFFGRMKARFSKAKSSVIDKGGETMNAMNVSGKAEEVLSKTTEALNSAKDIVSDLTGKAKDKASDIKNTVVDSISGSDSKVGSAIERGRNAMMNTIGSIKNSDMGNMDAFKSALKKVKEMKPSMAKRMKQESAAQYKARIMAMAEKLTGGAFGGKDKNVGSDTKAASSDSSDSDGDTNKITITGVKKKSFFSRLFGGKDGEMSDEEKYKRKSKPSLLGRLFGGHGRAVASTDPTPLPLTAGTQANINNFLPNIADTLNKIYKEMNGQLDGSGYNLETIKNILQTQFGSPDVEAKGMKTSRGNKTRRTKFGRMMDMIMSPVSVLIGKPLAFLSKFSPMKMLGKAFSLPKMLLEGVFGLPGKIAGGGKALFSLIMKPIELAGKSIAGGVKFLIDISSKVMGGLTDLVGKSLGHLTNIMTKGLDSMTNMIGTLGETVGTVMKSLPGIIASLGGVAIEGAKAVGRGLKTGIELTGKGIGNMIGMMKGVNIPNPSLVNKVEVVGGQLDNVKNVDTISLIKALAGMGPEYVDNAETRFMKETDGYKNIKKESEKDKEGTDKMQDDIGKMAKGSGDGFMSKLIKWLPTLATGLGGLVTFLSGAGFIDAIRNAFFNKDKTTEEKVEAGFDAVRYGNRTLHFGMKTANKLGKKGAEKLATFKGTRLGRRTNIALKKSKRFIKKAGKSLIDDGAKLAIKGKNIIFDILTNSKILKLIGGDKIIKRLTPVLKQITAKFGEKMAKGAVKKAAKAGAKASVRTGSRALAVTGIGAIVTAVVEAGFMTADFMSGYTAPNRYFKLPKDVEPDKNMRIAAGIGNLISGLLMEVDSFFEADDSPKLFVSLIYNQLASEEEQQKTKEQQKRMQEEFQEYKKTSGNEKLTFEEYNKQQNATIWEKAGKKISDVYNKGKNVVNKASEMYNNAKNSVVDKYNTAKDYVSDKYNSVVETIKKLSDPRFLGKVVGMGVGHLQKAWDKSVDYIKSIPDRVSQAISDLGGKIVEGYGNIKEGIKSFASSMVDRISNKAVEIKDGIINLPTKISEWWNSPGGMLDWIKDLPTKIWEKAIEWKDKIFNFGKDVKDAVVNKVEDVKNGVKNIFKKVTKAKDEFVEGYDEGKKKILEEDPTISKSSEAVYKANKPKEDKVKPTETKPTTVTKSAEVVQEVATDNVKDVNLEAEQNYKNEMQKIIEEGERLKKQQPGAKQTETKPTTVTKSAEVVQEVATDNKELTKDEKLANMQNEYDSKKAEIDRRMAELESKRDAARSASGYGAGSFVSQKSSRYSNIDMSIPGDRKTMKFSDVGCGPASMSMVLNSMGYNSNPEELASKSKQYRQPNMGTHYSMFGDVASGYGMKANTRKNNGVLGSGPSILLGQGDGGSGSPFGKTPHYVVADGVKGNKVKIKDPLSSSSKWYDKSSVMSKTNYVTEFGKGDEEKPVSESVESKLTNSGEIQSYISAISKAMAYFGKLAGDDTEEGESSDGKIYPTEKLSGMDISKVDFSKLPTRDMIFTKDKEKNKRAQYAASIILPRAQRAGHDPSLIMAQWAHETSWGSKAPGNNLFGVKAPKGWTGKTITFDTHEYFNGKKKNMPDKFKAFDSIEESVDDYISLVDRLYPNVKRDGAKGLFNSNYGIKGRDYATDPSYINKVVTMQNQMRKGFNLEQFGAGSLPSFNINTGNILSGLGVNTSNIEKAIDIMNGNGKPIKSISKINDKINQGKNKINSLNNSVDSKINNITNIAESYANAPSKAIEAVNREIESKLNSAKSSISNATNTKGIGNLANGAVDQVVGGVTTEITNSVKELTNSVKTLTTNMPNGGTGITGDNSNITEALNKQTKLLETMCQMLGAIMMNTNIFKVDPKSVEGRKIKTSLGVPIDQPFTDGNSDDLANQLIKRKY